MTLAMAAMVTIGDGPGDERDRHGEGGKKTKKLREDSRSADTQICRRLREATMVVMGGANYANHGEGRMNEEEKIAPGLAEDD